ncbi:hypothetical protein ASPFODRAFT_30676 [Aspergillus luchuensis CBS 106.47]|uniref:Uncharacterized protein n=1 Tax=Aspergillus luchuensis (strain CBS 106.47) TaxID=1137211 RepID=A0A1M3TSF8_ASPLC|nr:hypothetical protein ASPFODRAFT_30676 [Aspergillus luchuensis CBS 106.47]
MEYYPQGRLEYPSMSVVCVMDSQVRCADVRGHAYPDAFVSVMCVGSVREGRGVVSGMIRRTLKQMGIMLRWVRAKRCGSWAELGAAARGSYLLAAMATSYLWNPVGPFYSDAWTEYAVRNYGLSDGTMLGTYQWTLGSYSGLSGQRGPGKEYGIIVIVQEAMNMRCRLGVE